MTEDEIIAWMDRCAPRRWRSRTDLRMNYAWRWIAAWLLHNVAGMSIADICKTLHRDHASIVRALNIIDDAGPEVAAELKRVLGIARGNVVSIERIRA